MVFRASEHPLAQFTGFFGEQHDIDGTQFVPLEQKSPHTIAKFVGVHPPFRAAPVSQREGAKRDQGVARGYPASRRRALLKAESMAV